MNGCHTLLCQFIDAVGKNGNACATDTQIRVSIKILHVFVTFLTCFCDSNLHAILWCSTFTDPVGIRFRAHTVFCRQVL